MFANVGKALKVIMEASQFEASGEKFPSGDPAPKFTVLRMGERALTAPDGAFLRFACRSGMLPGSGPAHLGVGVERGGMTVEPEGDPEALKNAYATVAHSFSLAMAKELECENDGGLEARPSLDPMTP
ncbi:hypothetical protein [Streptomyces sp. NPDC059452]|uniref:hypothetical protein n=1 Tax=Streptomyces sp. NPDC059452 TaxID=3346835 RepID=UPI0036A8A65E